MPIDPEQRLVLDAMGAEHADGTPAAFEFGLIACRQNLKTYCLRAGALADLFHFRKPLSLWTVHRGFALAEAFREFKTTIDSYDHLRRRVRKIVEENGEEAIETTSGARLLFKLRTPGSGRSLAGDTVTLDEGYALTPEMIGDLYPTLATRPAAQVRIGSSAGHASSLVLRGIRDRGRAGGDPALGYVEWADVERPSCATVGCEHEFGTPGCCLDDPERWRRANPAMDRRIPRERIATFRRSMPAAEFAREEMGWWDDPVEDLDEPPITAESWSRLADSKSVIASGIACAVDVSPDRSMSAVAFSGMRADRLRHVELAAHGRGTSWAVDWLTARHRRWEMPVRLNPSGPAGALIADLERAGVPPELVPDREYRQACGALLDAVEAGTFRHRGQPELDEAVAAGRKRSVGEAFAWNRKDITADITPLVAATIALHGVRAFDISTQIY